jgi:hypothetical protein
MIVFIHIVSFYPNQKNAPILSLYLLSNCLTEEFIDVTIFTTNDSVVNVALNTLIAADFGKVQCIE